VTVARELIKRDILILSMGCGNAALQVAGLASLKAIELAGEGLKKSRRQQSMPFLPAYGITTHVSPIPPITGSEDAVRFFMKDIEVLTGGKFLVEEDPFKAAELIERVILEKRKALGLN
jgi:carbon-monoxide dehydrogenase catalytic subunit